MADVQISDVGATLDRLVDLDEISYEGDNIEGDLDSMLLNGGCLTF
jgi:hypothetical protein